MTPADLKEAIFGGFDGLTSNIGVIAGLLAAGTTVGLHIFAAALGLTIAATLGMGVGQYLSADEGSRSLRLAIVMAVATFIGSIVPALPFLFGFSVAIVVVSGVVSLLAAAWIGRYRGYRLTFSLLGVVALLTVLLAILV